jgi:hypothetical protein
MTKEEVIDSFLKTIRSELEQTDSFDVSVGFELLEDPTNIFTGVRKLKHSGNRTVVIKYFLPSPPLKVSVPPTKKKRKVKR